MLKRLGTVLHTTPNGYIVARLEREDNSVPPLNTVVYDEDMNRVGILLDIIGPITSPYVVIKPSSREVRVSEGTRLYYRPPTPRRRRGRRQARKPSRHRKGGKQRAETRRQDAGKRQPRRRERRRGGGGGGRPRGKRGRK